MIRIGTCAWSDHTGFYPPGLKSPQQIGYYARFFPLVEVDSTFYRPASARNCALWAERTPAHFRFHVKAHRALTWHDREDIPDPAGLREVVRPFADAVEPMRQAGKLTALHFQFAPWCTWGDRAHDYLRGLRETLPDHVVAVEFRHRSWFASAERSAETLAFLRQHGFVHTVCDEPQIGTGSVPAVVEIADARLAVVRLHGRNAATWYIRAATTGERFKYRYSPQELREWVEPLKSLAAKAPDVHVLMNNNHEDAAVRNASELASLLGLGYADPWAVEAPGQAPAPLTLWSDGGEPPSGRQ